MGAPSPWCVRRPHRRAHVAPAGVGRCPLLRTGWVGRFLGLEGDGRTWVATTRRRGAGVGRGRVGAQRDRAAGLSGPLLGGLRRAGAQPNPSASDAVEEACLDVVATTRSPLDRIQLLAGACQSRRTTAHRLLSALDRRSRMPDREWLRGVLRDIADGTCSVLEHGYLTRVERPHGLPRGQRQVFGRPCRTAGKVGILLASRGWRGIVRPCGPDCEAA